VGVKNKIFKFILTLGLLASFALINPEKSFASCAPKNDWTGLCDVGVECSSGICCNTTSECTTADPADYNYPTHDTTGTGINVGPTTTQKSSPKQNSSADIHGSCGENGISTAIGCISVLEGQEQFLGDILRWAVGIGGGIAFLLIVYAGFMIMTAAGNPERLKAGQELLTSAISGLVLLIFSVFVLRFIGVDILGLGAFGFGTK